MKYIKKALAMMLVLCMVFTMIPANAMASEFGADQEETVAETEAVEEAEAESVVTNAAEEAAEEDAAAEDAESEDVVMETIDFENEMVDELIQMDSIKGMESQLMAQAAVPYAVSDSTYITKNKSVPLPGDEFYRIFLLDAGRKYFSVDQIKGIIDQLAAKNYTHLQLLVGNDGLRFLLDDMSVSVNGTTFTSAQMTSAIQAGNRAYTTASSGELSQADMDTILAYAASKGISIIPGINSPGHMDAILYACKSLYESNAAYSGSSTTIDITNNNAVAFTQAVLQKYVNYFASKGCKIFNLGADEYAGTQFAALQSDGSYEAYAKYVNSVAAMIQNAGMTAMAFNDGIYYNGSNYRGNANINFDTDIAICYWTSGYTGYSPASASYLQSRGFTKFIHTDESWYYVLGRNDSSWAGYTTAANATKTIAADAMGVEEAGAMICVWCDTPGANYSQNASRITTLINNLSDSNPTYFVSSETTDPEPVNPVDPVEPTDPSKGEDAPNTVEVDIAIGETSQTYTQNGSQSIVTAGDSSIATAKTEVTTQAGTWSASATASLSNYSYGQAGVEPSSVIDGNPSTYYWSDRSQVAGAYVRVDMGKAQSISAVRVTPSTAHAADSVCTANVQVSMDGVNWTTVGTYNGAQTTTVTFNETQARYVQVVLTADKSSTWWALAEIEWGSMESNGTETVYNGSTYTLSTDNYSTYADGTYYYLNNNNYYKITAISTSTTGKKVNFNITTTGGQFSVQTGNNQKSVNTTLYKATERPAAGKFTQAPKSGTGGASTTTTNVTFTGVTPGTTTYVIGNTTYNVHVSEKAPAGAMTGDTLTLEFWITNATVHKTNSSTSASSATINKSAASTEEGVLISDYAPQNAYAFFDGTIPVYYWQSVRLDSANKQTGDAGDDETSDGTRFTRVRFYNKAWQYMTTDGVWHYFMSTDQAVAYYLQKKDVSPEVNIMYKDWGVNPGEYVGSQNQYPQVALSVAVVYPDGTLSPAESSIYSNSTIMFNYWDGRDIGIVAPENNSDYEIEKLTYTYGTRASGTSNTWSSTAGINWNKKTTAAGTQWFDETEVWNDTMDTTPMVNGKKDNIVWSAKDKAVLVLIYLKPIHHDSNLEVVWYDNSGSEVIATQPIVVNYTSGSAPTFLTDIVNNGKKGASAGTIDLKDNAYITNSSGVNQTFNKDLTVMQNISGKYASGLYTYVGADISEDGKTLTLHYELKSDVTYDPNYVVDFGLPMTFPVSDLVSNVSSIKSIVLTSNATYNRTNQTITYTPSATLKSIEPVTATITFNDNTTVKKNVGMVPATTVYYEEGFASYTGTWGGNASKGTGVQSTEKIKKNESTGVYTTEKKNNYGFDPKYAAEGAGASNGTQATTSTKGSMATFSFTGTGVEVYANCGDTGVVNFILQQDGKTKKLVTVDTSTESSIYSAYSGSTEYSLPIVSVNNLPYGNYTVKLVNVVEGKNFKFDGFRVSGTLADQDNAYYSTDLEDSPVFFQLRDYVLTAIDGVENQDSASVYAQVQEATQAALADGKTTGVAVVLGNTTAYKGTDLLTEGPKNELFLLPGQQVVFNINTSRKVQVGLKAVNGAVNVSGSYTGTIKSSTDMFYSVSGSTITIKNNGTSGILSVTKVKVCDDPSAAMTALTLDELAMAMGELQPVETADSTLTVTLYEKNKSKATTTITVNGPAGEIATITAAEIKAAADQVVPAGYTVDASSVSDVKVEYGKNASAKVTIQKGGSTVAPSKPGKGGKK